MKTNSKTNKNGETIRKYDSSMLGAYYKVRIPYFFLAYFLCIAQGSRSCCIRGAVSLSGQPLELTLFKLRLTYFWSAASSQYKMTSTRKKAMAQSSIIFWNQEGEELYCIRLQYNDNYKLSECNEIIFFLLLQCSVRIRNISTNC